MMKDIPYIILKQNERAYKIMLLRDQHNYTFSDIAKEFQVSVTRIVTIYNRQKIEQIRLYINHIAVVLGLKNALIIKKVFDDAYECYEDLTYACAYLEKKYEDILTGYRNGEPGMPRQFIKSIPPFKTKFNKKTINRVIEMREVKKMSFVIIAKELSITQAKAKRIYEMFYHEQVLEHIEALQKKAENKEEKIAIWEYYLSGNESSKKRFDMLMNR